MWRGAVGSDHQELAYEANQCLIKGDGIGVDVSNAAMTLVNQAITQCGLRPLIIKEINGYAAYFAETGGWI